MIAGITAQIISAPRGEWGIGDDSLLLFARGVNAARRIATSAITQRTAATQNIGTAIGFASGFMMIVLFLCVSAWPKALLASL